MKQITKITKITQIRKWGTALGTVLVLSGCAGYQDVSAVSMMPDQGDAFATALHQRYTERATYEVGQDDWTSVGFFNERAARSAAGTVPALQKPEDRDLKSDSDAINSSYDMLSKALASGAPSVAADACALSQTWFEHWMEQAEEGHQNDHIATSRDAFYKALPGCRVEMAAAPVKAVPALPDAFIIYFDFDSQSLTSASQSIIDQAVMTAKAAKATRVVLIGHADRSGNEAYNMALSRARVVAVAGALKAAGVAANMVQESFAGETSPQVATVDGKRERLNRRVEVIFER